MFLRFDSNHFERAFGEVDPWRYRISEYERTKYQRQIDAIKRFRGQPTSILEVGCAEGVFTTMLSEAFPESSVSAIDISPTAIARAKENCKSCCNIELAAADAISLFLDRASDDHRFDVIVQSESLHYVFVRLFLLRRLRSYLHGAVQRLNQSGILVTSNGINPQTRWMLLASYRILRESCHQEMAADYREWSDFRRKHLRYDLRVFRLKSSTPDST